MLALSDKIEIYEEGKLTGVCIRPRVLARLEVPVSIWSAGRSQFVFLKDSVSATIGVTYLKRKPSSEGKRKVESNILIVDRLQAGQVSRK